MRSNWVHLKGAALQARREGKSIRQIEKELSIPKSTLSGWFRNIELAENLRRELKRRSLEGLSRARERAAIWHKDQKIKRIEDAKREALSTLKAISFDDAILELALSILYLGEGAKAHGTGMGSSDPLILRFFIYVLKKVYKVKSEYIKCALHLRADQDPVKLQRFWSGQLGLSPENFTLPSIDLRSSGKPTYATYNGVCVVTCGKIAIQRKLIFLSRSFCERAVSSAGRAHS